MSLASAGGASVLRAAQKDEYFINRLTASASELLRLFGNRTWHRYSHLLTGGSQILYGGLTTLKDLQTLGEEYTGIVQVDDTYVRLPAKFYQLIAIVLGACGEAAVRRALNKLKKDIKNNKEMIDRPKRMLLKSLIVVQWLLPVFKDLHRAWFYMGGRHYDVSKRVTRINYVNSVPGAMFHTDLLKPLGIPCLLRAVLNAAASPPSFEELEVKQIDEGASGKSNCIGCLEINVTPCALPCGHVLCNNCARSAHSCALCRSPYHPNRTVPLQNISFE